MAYAVMVKSKEGHRLIENGLGCRWEHCWLTSTWAIEDTLDDAIRAKGQMENAFIVPADKRFEYVGMS